MRVLLHTTTLYRNLLRIVFNLMHDVKSWRRPQTIFTVTLVDAVQFRHASLASGGRVAVSTDRRSFTFALPATTEVLILRP